MIGPNPVAGRSVIASPKAVDVVASLPRLARRNLASTTTTGRGPVCCANAGEAANRLIRIAVAAVRIAHERTTSTIPAMSLVSLAAIQDAARRINGIARRTPLLDVSEFA